ncbi:MAG: CRISPR-associated helicase/endonuclease Cas3 [Candidatus Melainabacteria bacterium HGW-Melainabacteria-1]|nr:MAG: CRISPR-associated helicase/endonuclease Cas3 [Candidatus Melainabacteria bacterium HGW-Melainabacteria-1]
MCLTLLPSLVAHTPNQMAIWHSLQTHLESVASQAEIFAAKFNAGALARCAGLWHDSGKVSLEFQAYLRACALAAEQGTKAPVRGPDHKTAGSVMANEHRLLPVAFAIQGHHGGLPNATDLRVTLAERKEQVYIRKAITSTKAMFTDFQPISAQEMSQHPAVKQELEAELFTRMLYSTLVDADFLDTEAHFDESKSNLRSDYPSLETLWERFSEDQGRLLENSAGSLNELRREIYEACLANAENPQGMFRLTVPTGGGKTRVSLGFALQHALHHNLDRIIVVIPYTSIIEQTADIYRSILGNDAVIEHHSSIQFADDPNNPTQAEIQARLATENWDAPVIVTTSVQFFESLFSNKPSKCRKLHNICRSVVILDEVQTLPSKLLSPICDGLQQLVRHYAASLILCTATQPAWEHSPWLENQQIAELVPEPERYFSALERVDYELALDTPLSWEALRDRLLDFDQVLCIVNTKPDALELLELMPQEHTYHLSTLLCGAHRREVLATVRERLKQGLPCRLISTQVVEAGVDLDFPAVFRALGPLDRIVQAAGRCNREGKMAQKGKVVIFQPTVLRLPPGEYQRATETALTILAQQNWNLNSPEVFNIYFRYLYQLTKEALGKQIQDARKSMQFADVADKFKLIPDDTVSVVVRYPGTSGPSVDELMSRLQQPWHSPKRVLRQLQPYMVNILKFTFSQYQREGLARELMPGLYEWLGQYDALKGLSSNMIEPEDLVL